MKNVFFIVGPHGVGKTYISTILSDLNNAQHIDLGPLIREAHRAFAPNITFQNWVEDGERKYGKNFTDIILCKQIERITSVKDKETTIITGNRSLGGIKFIAERFLIDNPKIIYITAKFEQMKNNYEKREKLNLTEKEFKSILQAEKNLGLDHLEEYAKYHGLYLQNDNTDNFINTIQTMITKNKKERDNER